VRVESYIIQGVEDLKVFNTYTFYFSSCSTL